VGDALNTPMNRSHAQELRTDRVLTFESQSARASFWAGLQRRQAQQQQEQMDEDVSSISEGSLKSNTTFATANIEEATLESAAPAQPGEATLAGLGEGGIAPPPVTR
jgi:hypothetical protein